MGSVGLVVVYLVGLVLLFEGVNLLCEMCDVVGGCCYFCLKLLFLTLLMDIFPHLDSGVCF